MAVQAGEVITRETVTPSGLKIAFTAKPHGYVIEDSPIKATSVTEATGLLKDVGPMAWWGMKVGLDGASLLQAEGVELATFQTDELAKMLTERKLTVNHQRDRAASRGTAVHDAAEQYASTGTVPNPNNFPTEQQGYVQALCAWLLATEPTPLGSEVMVGDGRNNVAGTADLFCELDGLRTIVDYKTSKGVYVDQLIQVGGGYRHLAVESGYEEFPKAAILRLGADGEWEFVESPAQPWHFLAILKAHRAFSDVARQFKAAKKAAR